MPTRPARALALIRDVLRRVEDSHLGLIAAGVAFFGLLAVFPALAALVALWGLAADPALVAAELEAARDLLPAQAFDILAAQIDALVRAPSGRLGWTTALTVGAALWSARAGVAALVQGLNAVHGVPNRGSLGHHGIALVLTLVLVAVALAILAAGIVVPLILAFVPIGPAAGWAIALLRWTILPLVTLIGLAIVFRYGPNLPAGRRVRFLSPGLALALTLGLLASEGFALYLTNFGSYNAVYGSIGAVVALLVWFYLGAWSVLLGGALDASLSARRQ